MGGDCLNTGCVPSKALIAAGQARHVAADAGTRFAGITTSAGPVDMASLVAGTQDLVEDLRAEKYTDVANAHGWRVLPGQASFAGTPEAPVLEVRGPEGGVGVVEAAHYLIATGARAWTPPIEGLADVGYLTSTTAMELSHVPDSLHRVGGGVRRRGHPRGPPRPGPADDPGPADGSGGRDRVCRRGGAAVSC